MIDHFCILHSYFSVYFSWLDYFLQPWFLIGALDLLVCNKSLKLLFCHSLCSVSPNQCEMVLSHVSFITEIYVYNFETAASQKPLLLQTSQRCARPGFWWWGFPFGCFQFIPHPPHSPNQEMMEELITNPVDPKGMSWTIVIIPTTIGTMGRFLKWWRKFFLKVSKNYLSMKSWSTGHKASSPNCMLFEGNFVLARPNYLITSKLSWIKSMVETMFLHSEEG